MSEPATIKSERNSIAIALIGGLATIVAALIGLIANSNNSRADRAALDDSGRKEERRQQTSGALHTESGGGKSVIPPIRLVLSTPPPAASSERTRFSISYRKAAIPGHGVVLGLTNATDKETLKNVVVLVKSSAGGGERSYRVARSLSPKETISVGWKELDGWKLNPGDVVKVKVDGDARPVEVIIPRL